MINLNKVFSECAEYVNELKKCPKGYFLYRGSKLQIDDIQTFESHLEDRKPVNSPQALHDAVNDTFVKQFGWKIRNGVFCYGFTSLDDVPDDLGYGRQYLCFPIGRFSFVFSPEHFDLCGHFHKKNYTLTDEELKALPFNSGTLADAIDSNKYRNGLSNEISVNVTTYYLVDVKHRQEIADLIWP